MQATKSKIMRRPQAQRASATKSKAVAEATAEHADSSLIVLDIQPGEADGALGFSADWAPGKIFTTRLKEGSWASQHGLITGSELCTLNGQPVRAMSQEKFVGLLKGRPLKIAFRPPVEGKSTTRSQSNHRGYPVQNGSRTSYGERRSTSPVAPAVSLVPSEVTESPSKDDTSTAVVTNAGLSRGSNQDCRGSSPAQELKDAPAVKADPSPDPAPMRTLPPNLCATPLRQMRRSRSSLAGHTGSVAGHHSFADDEEASSVATAALKEAPEPEEEICENGPLSISTRLEYTSLKVDTAYNVFGLVTLQAPEAEVNETLATAVDSSCTGKANSTQADERAPVDVTCVLDVSGSMDGAKIQLLKDAVMFVISELGAADRLSIVTFQSNAQRHIRLMRMNETGKDSARQATMRLVAGGGTDIAAGLNCGISVMEQRRQRNPVGAIFLLTDGQDQGVHRHIPGLVARARAAQSAIYTFGFGSDHDATTMSSIAETAQTPFTFVERLENIREAFAGAVSGIMSVVAQNIDLTIEPLGGSEIVALHTHFAQRHDDGGVMTVNIPDAFEGERRDVVVELRVPAACSGGPVLQSRASYKTVRERGTSVHTSPVFLEVARSQEPEEEPDEEVVAQKERVQVADAMEIAIARGEDGHFEEARSVLEAEAEKLQRKRSPTETSKALLSEVQDAQRRLSSASSWSRGGKAEVSDRAKMHKYQRCTNLYEVPDSASACVAVSSKAQYATSKQKSAVLRSKTAKD